MEEKIIDEFVKKDWNNDITEQRKQEIKEYKKTAIELIAKAVARNDLRNIKEIIEELENEIGEI